jgi:phosphatidylglycerol:prolipoprotein diacylglycerol transferase
MYPVLIDWKIPASWGNLAGPSSWLYAQWKLLAVIFGVVFVAYLWATDPDQGHKRKGAAWLTSIASLILGGALALVGLVALGEVKLHTYGVMIAVAFLVGILLTIREGRRIGLDADRVLDLAFWILIFSMVGSRVLFIITEWSSYWSDLMLNKPLFQKKLFRIWEGGLVFHGGLIGGLLATFFYVRKYKLNFFLLADTVVPVVALGQFFGRVGCFSAGCCHGKPCDLSWAVTFPPGIAIPGALHPSQLYEASAVLLIFFILLWQRSIKRFHGQVVIVYLMLYAIVRFFLEIFRGDISRGFLFEFDFIQSAQGPDILTWGQMISLLLFALAFILIPLAKAYQAHLAAKSAPSVKPRPAKARR